MRRSKASSGGGVVTADYEIADVTVKSEDSALPEGERNRAVTARVPGYLGLSNRLLTYFGETGLTLAALTVMYVIAIANSMTRKMWFDELFTYYISQAPSLSRLMDALTHVDLNPPLNYLLVRVFHIVFGSSEFVTRLPSALGFYCGSVGAFVFLRRRIGVMWSAVAILLFWSTPYLRYATQARPYGLLLGFFALTLVSYDRASQPERSRWAVSGIAAGSIGMMLSHVFAPLSIFPFCAAEAVRCAYRRRVDWPVLTALVLPVSMSAAYIPATHVFQQIYFPELYQASWRQVVYFFERLSILYALPMFIASVLAFVAIPYSAARRRRVPGGWPEMVCAVSILFVPAILNLVLARTQGAFWERYCITTALAFYMLFAIALGWGTGFRRSSGGIAALVLCVLTLVRPYGPDHGIPDSAALKTIRQDIPLVTASGLTFLEMDHYESADFKSRLYYLVDRDAAIKYAHSTIFENFPQLTHYFPIRAHVAPYDAFIAAHPHFLVLTRADYREVWVLDRLRHDGARITFSRLLSGPVKDAQLYEVYR